MWHNLRTEASARWLKYICYVCSCSNFERISVPFLIILYELESYFSVDFDQKELLVSHDKLETVCLTVIGFIRNSGL